MTVAAALNDLQALLHLKMEPTSSALVPGASPEVFLVRCTKDLQVYLTFLLQHVVFYGFDKDKDGRKHYYAQIKEADKPGGVASGWRDVFQQRWSQRRYGW